MNLIKKESAGEYEIPAPRPRLYQAKLVRTKAGSGTLCIIANGAELCLTYTHLYSEILSVIDSKGRIVKVIQQYLSFLLKQAGISVAPSTIEQYGHTLSYLCRWIETANPYPEMTIEEVILILDRLDVVAWIKSMKSQGAEAHATLHSREACLKEFLKWLTTIDGGKRRTEDNSPWGKDDRLGYVVSAPSPLSPKPITSEVVISILNNMHNECERCMFHTQYDTGLRISELIQLTNADLPYVEQFDASIEFLPFVVNGKKGRGGQKKQRITLISRAVLNRIKRYHASPAYQLATDWKISEPLKPVFLTSHQHAWQSRNASKQFKAAVKRSGVSLYFRSHWMRHGTAFSVLRSDAGKTLEDRFLIAQQMLGHAKLSTTQIYTQFSPSILIDLTKEGKKIDRLEEAENIRNATFLPALMHRERRGHK